MQLTWKYVAYLSGTYYFSLFLKFVEAADNLEITMWNTMKYNMIN